MPNRQFKKFIYNVCESTGDNAHKSVALEMSDKISVNMASLSMS